MAMQLSGSLEISGSIIATQGITGSFSGNATSASYADTLQGLGSASFAITGSNTFTGPQYVSQASNAISFTSTASLYTDGGLRVAKDSYVSGTAYFNNITVYGTSSIEYITSSQVNIGANIITVNTDTPAVRFGGLSVFDSGSTQLTGSLFWDSEKNHWVYANPSGSTYSGGMLMSGPRASSLGNEQGTLNNYVMKGQGGDHITSSQIIDDGTLVSMYSTMYVTSSGFVGIGKSAPSTALDILGSGVSPVLIQLASANPNCDITLQSSNSSNNVRLRNNSDDFQIFTSGSQRMIIDAIGRLGIGTATPSYTIDVFTPSGSGTGNLGRFYYNDGTYNPRLQITGDSSGITFFESFSTGANSLKFSIAGSNTLVLKGDNVGIGTTTPSTSLDVNGTGRFTSLLTINGLSPITASGGTITTPGDGFKYHTFTSSGTFTVTAGLNTVEVAVVAGGGAGGGDFSGLTFYAGGGGAGGVVYNPSYLVTSGSYTVTVGAGGTPNALSNAWGGNGENSVFGTITAIGGGGGARGNGDNTSPVYTGLSGGSGGGGGSNGGVGGSSLTPLGSGTSYGGKGFNSNGIAGGGGGATSAGGTVAGPGGNGINIFTTGSKYAGGGGAGIFSGNPTANAGTDGGGNGGYWNGSNPDNSGGLPGAANRGGGGGGIGYNIGNGGAGGSGIVIVRYKA
jgi:hypothetical protein